MFFSASFSEGFPNAIAEAALYGVPILSSDVSDLKNGFLDSWQICDPNDTDGFSEAFRKIFTSSKLVCKNYEKDSSSNFQNKLIFKKI